MKSGNIYLIHCEGFPYYKIGVASCTTDRLLTLQIGCPFPLHLVFEIKVPDAYRVEKEIHQEISSKRLQGEWFTLSEQDVTHIQNLLEQYADDDVEDTGQEKDIPYTSLERFVSKERGFCH